MGNASGLTPKQQLFVERYLIHRNATKASIEAGYSENRASEIGYQQLQKTTVQNAISEGCAQISRRNEISQDWVIQNLKRQAEVRMSMVAESDNRKLVLKKGLSKEQIDAFDSYSYTNTNGDTSSSETVRWKIRDSIKPLELIGRHLGMFDGKGSESKREDPEAYADDLCDLVQKSCKEA